MDTIYVGPVHFQKGIKIIFVSKRLAKFIHKQSIASKWVFYYFRLFDNLIFGEYKCVLINTNGVMIAVKRRMK